MDCGALLGHHNDDCMASQISGVSYILPKHAGRGMIGVEACPLGGRTGTIAEGCSMFAYLALSAMVLGPSDLTQRGEGGGTAVLPELQSRLADETCMERHCELLDCLVRADGKSAIPVLERLLRDDKIFWNNLGMNLDEPAKLPAVRVERLAAILHHLAVLGYRDPLHLVRDVHERFRDHPVLCEHGRAVIAAAQALMTPE
jgi:hypothetical protein